MREIKASEITDVVERLCIEANEQLPRTSKVPSAAAERVKTGRQPREFWTRLLRILRSRGRSMCPSVRTQVWHVCSWRSVRTYISRTAI